MTTSAAVLSADVYLVFSEMATDRSFAVKGELSMTYRIRIHSRVPSPSPTIVVGAETALDLCRLARRQSCLPEVVPLPFGSLIPIG